MNNYTEADYRRIYADLERQEQESVKAYNNWLMQMKMAINNYNTALRDSGLDEKFQLIEATTDEEIELLDITGITAIYQEIMSFKEETKNTIEVALGLTECEVEETHVGFGCDFDEFNLEEINNPLGE